MNNNIFYQIMQNGRGVGFFRKLKNAKLYASKFNTRTEVFPLEIVKRSFLDDDYKAEDDEDDGQWPGSFNWGEWNKNDPDDCGAV